MNKAVVALIIYRNSLLLLKRARGPFKGAWEFPNEPVKRGETAQEAIKHHLKTTFGIDVLPLRVLDGFNTAYPQHDITLLRCSIISHPTSVSPGNDYSDHLWAYILNTATLAFASIHDDIAKYLLTDKVVLPHLSK